MKFILTTFPGLAGLALAELVERSNIVAVAKSRVRGSELLQVETADPTHLLGLRLIEDVFAEIGRLNLTGRGDDLRALTKLLAREASLSAAVAAYDRAAGRKIPDRTAFRVVAQADDAAWRSYRRVDMQKAAEAGLARARPNWRLTPDEAPVEVWLHQVGHELHVSLRLTGASHRARGGRAVEREAALRPTIAAAMVYLSRPQDDDVFLDPMCGSGTILLERALAGRHGLLLGGDIDLAAVKATQANFGPRHKPWSIERLDARKLPLEDGSVDVYATNLPWGRQVGSPDDLPRLYRGVLAEAVRVVKPGGRIMLLTSEWELMKRLIKQTIKVKMNQTVSNVEVLGRRADIFVMDRT